MNRRVRKLHRYLAVTALVGGSQMALVQTPAAAGMPSWARVKSGAEASVIEHERRI